MSSLGLPSLSPLADERRAPARPRRLGRLLRLAVKLVAVLVLLPFLVVPLLALTDPPVTMTMLAKRLGGAPIDKAWTPLDRMSPHLIRAVLSAEDARFCLHRGVDFTELKASYAASQRGRALRGASTLTMQTVKNLFFTPSRSYLRKVMEIPLALWMDLVLPKRRVLELYLNIAEWDTGVYGAGLAARRHFKKDVGKLTRGEAARLVAALPAPETRDPRRPSRRMAAYARIIERRAAVSGATVGCVLPPSAPAKGRASQSRSKPL